MSQYAFRPLVALPLATGTLVFLLGAVVLIRERASRISILFVALTSSVAVWLFAFSLMYASLDEPTALFWARAAFLGIAFIPTAVYHFIIGVARLERRLQTMVRDAWLLYALLSLLILT